MNQYSMICKAPFSARMSGGDYAQGDGHPERSRRVIKQKQH
jgi:hypothetical protein